jgi:DNA (cytosine-5)-methyltransferase 1
VIRRTNVDHTKELTHLSLCTGYEGIGRGLRGVFPGCREIAYVEIEAFAIANLVAKMEEGHLHPAPIYSDLKTFPFKEFRNRVSFLSAGFPCQPFSAAGRGASTEDPRHLYPFIARGISECRPTYVILENVEGIIWSKTADGQSVLQYVLGDLEERGYKTSWGIFSAEEVGAPHQRKRVFILAYSNIE